MLSMIEKVFEISFGSRNPHSAERLTQGEKKKLIFSFMMFTHASFPPVDSERVWCKFHFLQKGEQRNTKREPVSARARPWPALRKKHVDVSLERFAKKKKTLRNHSELQADKQASY